MRNIHKIDEDFFITSNEKIKINDWCLTEKLNIIQRIDIDTQSDLNKLGCKKIILTTNEELIKNGIQELTEQNIEWLSKNTDMIFVNTKYSYPTIADETDYLINKGYYRLLSQSSE